MKELQDDLIDALLSERKRLVHTQQKLLANCEAPNLENRSLRSSTVENDTEFKSKLAKAKRKKSNSLREDESSISIRESLSDESARLVSSILYVFMVMFL